MPPLTEDDVTEAAHIVGQMGMGPFRKALEADVDVIIAGRACDTAIFASLPMLLGFPAGLAMHMAKIIECGSLCCVPGGRDPILAELDHDGFVLESMNPERRATPTSVAAHSLYEQADPFTMQEPDGTLDLSHADYQAVDDRRTRVSGAAWRDTATRRSSWKARERSASARCCCAGQPILGSSSSARRCCRSSPTWCKAWSARISRWTTRCAAGSTAWTACAWWCRQTRHRRAKCSSWANASRRPVSARRKWCAPASSFCCISAIRAGFDRRQPGLSVYPAGGFARSSLPVQRLPPAACRRRRRAVSGGNRSRLNRVHAAVGAPSGRRIQVGTRGVRFEPRALQGPAQGVDTQRCQANAIAAGAHRAHLHAVAQDRGARRRRSPSIDTGTSRRLTRPRYLVRAVSSWPI